jgi:hydrogenase nickel incorporation protein HypB
MNLVPRIIDVKASVLADNDERAGRLRSAMSAQGVFLVNVMGSPGAGKTSLLAALLPHLPPCMKPAVIEADLDSRVDADALERLGWKAVQLRTGGFCHLDSYMVERGLEELGITVGGTATGTEAAYTIVFIENVGNLICTAQVDTGAHLDIAILSVPEGDDKPLKYPVMFAMADVIVVGKADYLGHERFDIEGVRRRVAEMNPKAVICVVSARTGAGVEELAQLVAAKAGSSAR